ncbi:MAG TPA: anti-sigma factor [Thermoanaerobaculia bacterium]|nr:anti-sigma factor [Thermoanaerobaculia bacterium]
MTHEETESIAVLDALGIASAGDAVVLAMHVAACLPCRRARDEYRRATTLIALGLEPVPPPRAVREQLVESVTRAAASRRSSWRLAAAAALVLALFGAREFTVQRERARLKAENAKLVSELSALGAPDTRTIALAGQEIAPRASAKVFLEPDRRRAIVFFHDLPENPGDKSYQLWIIRAGRPAPVSAGVFDVTASGKASLSIENLPVAAEIQALAVTLEPRGGVPQPTNTRFVVAGNAL